MDDQKFRKSLPIEMIPLKMKGAFTSPPIPKDFNIDTASPTDLAKFGIPRIPSDQSPARVAEWKRRFAPARLTQGRIVPVLSPQKGKTHFLRGFKRSGRGRDPPATSNNWAGGIVLGKVVPPTLALTHALDGYETSFYKQQHVNFIGTDNHVHELYFVSQWIHTDLTGCGSACRRPRQRVGRLPDVVQQSAACELHRDGQSRPRAVL